MREKLKFTNFYQEMMIVKEIAEKENSNRAKDNFNNTVSDLARKSGIYADKVVPAFI